MLPDALIFDLDGTIADTESIEYASVAEVWSRRGLPFGPDRWAHVIGQSWSPEWVGELQESLFALGRDVPEADVLHDEQHAVKRDLLDALVPREGIVELLDAAQHNGVPLGIASNSPLRWVEARLAQLGLADRFEVLSTLDVASAAKPDPAPYREACERLGARPEHSVAFEDSTTGTISAVAAGLFTIVCPGPLTAGHDLSAAHLRVATHTSLSLASITTQFERFVAART